MQKKYVIILLVSVFLSLLALLFWRNNQTLPKERKITIRNHDFTVEIADTDTLRGRGLSGRKNLPSQRGMLFLFPTRAIYSFWMKDMLFPLDFIWIDGNAIVDITKNVPPPKSKTTLLTTYAPEKPVDKVLEVTAGTIERVGIEKGDKIQLF